MKKENRHIQQFIAPATLNIDALRNDRTVANGFVIEDPNKLVQFGHVSERLSVLRGKVDDGAIDTAEVKTAVIKL